MMQRLATIVLLSLLVSTSALLSTNRRNKKHTNLWAVSDRRVFLDASALAGYTFFTSMPVGASDLDLSMPDEAQQIEQQKAEMEARLKRKAELQKKASKPQTFTESLMGEMSKQKDMEKSKQERRDAMCEELGRGC